MAGTRLSSVDAVMLVKEIAAKRGLSYKVTLASKNGVFPRPKGYLKPEDKVMEHFNPENIKSLINLDTNKIEVSKLIELMEKQLTVTLGRPTVLADILKPAQEGR